MSGPVTQRPAASDADLAACAGLLQRGDPDRFRAAMSAPLDLRRKLIPLYAFNLEVARAPWVTQEPLIAEMRLQWWRDALEEIGADGAVRRHEVVTPLAAVLDTEGAQALDRLVEARRADIEKGAPEGRDALWSYLQETAGTLLWVAGRMAGADAAAKDALRDAGTAQGAASFLGAVPDLTSKGHHALPHGDQVAEMRDLAERGLAALDRAAGARLAKPLRPVLAVMAGVRPRLQTVLRNPDAAFEQAPDVGPFTLSRRSAMILLTGRF